MIPEVGSIWWNRYWQCLIKVTSYTNTHIFYIDITPDKLGDLGRGDYPVGYFYKRVLPAPNLTKLLYFGE